MDQTKTGFASSAEGNKEGNEVLTSLRFSVKLKGNEEVPRRDMGKLNQNTDDGLWMS